MSNDPYIDYHLAISDGDLKRVRELVKTHNLDINTPHPQLTNYTPLYHAAAARAYDILDYLLKNKVQHDPNFTFELAFGGNFATTEQRREGERQFIKLHKKYQFSLKDIDGMGNSLVHIASSNGGLAFLKYVYNEIGHSNPRNRNNNTALHAACIFKNPEAVTFLTHKKNAPVNAKNDDGYTALHLAIAEKMPLKDILAHPNIDVNIKDKNGSTPLHLTALSYPEGKRLLLETGKCDLNAQDANGMTALHCLHLGDHFYAIKPLLDMGADPNIKDKNGNTALAFALGNVNIDTIWEDAIPAIKALAEKCDPYIQNKNGKDCFDLARNHPEPRIRAVIDNLRIEKRVKEFQDQAKIFKNQRKAIKIKRRQPKP